jgi:FkbM family methyltransferase
VAADDEILASDAEPVEETSQLLDPGEMTGWQLSVLEYFLARHFGADAKLKTLETGCGKSTLVFAKYSSAHMVFCSEDTIGLPAAADALRSDPELKEHAVEFIIGPTIKNLLQRENAGALDIVLIGGSRSHPIPDSEYMAISGRLQRGSILVLRDIHIPTIQALFRILCEEDALHLSQTLENTAFFWCASAPSGTWGKQPWWSQRYNAQRMAGIDTVDYTVADRLPIRLSFDGWLRELPSCFKRGAIIKNGRPVIGGPMSRIVFHLAESPAGDIEIELEIDCGQPDPIYYVRCEINGVDRGTLTLAVPGTQKLCLTVDLAGSKSVEIVLHNTGVSTLAEAPLLSIGVREARQGDVQLDGPTRGVVQTEGAIATFDWHGQVLNFFVHDQHDSIQAHHAIGEFYETEELDLIARHLKPGARVLDIGSNIGNHTVWFEKIAGASYVLVIEPQPRMIKHLKLNCALNRLRTVDYSQLGKALGNKHARGRVEISQSFNAAGAVVRHDPDGQIPIYPGDEIVGDAHFDFVKIDVESAEIEVIEGLSAMIARCRPVMFVEVANENSDRFMALVGQFDYEVAGEYRRYDMATNYLVRPKASHAS